MQQRLSHELRGRLHRGRPGLTVNGFSLVELVIVVVIIGVLAAIAIPRFSRAADGAADAALKQNLRTMREALEMYKAEHKGAVPKDATAAEQLTQYTDLAGNVSATASDVHPFGPYLHRVPPLPVGIRQGNAGLFWTDAEGVGWLYSEMSQTIKAHASGEYESRGVDYATY